MAKTRPLHIVVDTNVLMGAAWNRTPRGIIELWERGHVTVCVSDPIVREYRHILSKTPQSRTLLKRIEPLLAQSPGTLHLQPTRRIEAISEDPSDNMYLECAVEASATIILSSDHHLKDVDGFEGIRVMSAGAFLKRRMELEDAAMQSKKRENVVKRCLQRIFDRKP